MTIKIDIFADVVCPWCRIGEARLNKAIAQFSEQKFSLTWRPFQLRPDMPVEGMQWETFVMEKFGGPKRAAPMFQRVADIGRLEGIAFNFDNITVAANTVNAHRLILYAAKTDNSWAMSHTLYKAYFEDGLNIGDEQTLVELAVTNDFDADTIQTFLRSDELSQDVTSSQIQAHQFGITGVPFFIFNDRYGISGAQPTELFVEAIEKTLSEVSIS